MWKNCFWVTKNTPVGDIRPTVETAQVDKKMKPCVFVCIFLLMAVCWAASNSSEHTISCSDFKLDVPCVDVPKCSENKFASLSKFVTMSNKQPQQSTTVDICYVEGESFKVHMVAEDHDVFSPYTTCNSEVYVNSDVLEVFMTPTKSPYDAPQWYYEMDTSPSNAVWVGHKNNSLGNWSNCNHQDDHCVAGTIKCEGLNIFPQFPNLVADVINFTAGWSNDLNIPFTIGPPEYRDSKIWRANFYRYDYPISRDVYELSGWSPTFCDSFHVPQQFGVLILRDLKG
jgi:hypothetical protein